MASVGSQLEARAVSHTRSGALWSFVRRLVRDPLGLTGAVIVLIIVLSAAGAPLIATRDPKAIDGRKFETPSAQFWLGTDQLGRDIYSRTVWGARLSLYVGISSVLIGVTFGALWGVISGYAGGMVDLSTQRIVDVLGAFPSILLALVLMAVLGVSIDNVILAVTVVLIPASARTLRSVAMSVTSSTYIEAARAIGASAVRTVFMHVLPNCAAAWIVLASINVGWVIIIEASLSFLGAGIPPEEPSWGTMLTVAAQNYVSNAMWLAVVPGVALSLTVLGFSFLGDSLRDILDPRLRNARL